MYAYCALRQVSVQNQCNHIDKSVGHSDKWQIRNFQSLLQNKARRNAAVPLELDFGRDEKCPVLDTASTVRSEHFVEVHSDAVEVMRLGRYRRGG